MDQIVTYKPKFGLFFYWKLKHFDLKNQIIEILTNFQLYFSLLPEK